MENISWISILGQVIAVLCFFLAVLVLAGLLTWVERKQSALMQDRIGANRAEICGFRFWGVFHILADALKMLVKESFIPEKADKLNLISISAVVF